MIQPFVAEEYRSHFNTNADCNKKLLSQICYFIRYKLASYNSHLIIPAAYRSFWRNQQKYSCWNELAFWHDLLLSGTTFFFVSCENF